MASSEPSCEREVSKPTPVNNSISSCLRQKNACTTTKLSNRSVSFPDDESQIVTGYLEPANPWVYAECPTKEKVIDYYIKSCEKHGTRPIKSILDQLEHLDYDVADRFDVLDLKGEQLVLESCEAMEEILKRLQFIKLNLEDTGLDDEAAVALFDMIEYYEVASHLNISGNMGIGMRGWQACSRMLKKTKCLEQLECKNAGLTDQHMLVLSRAFRIGTQLQVLKLENSSLSGRPIVILVAALKLNTSLKELYLADNSLTSHDAIQLGALLKCNVHLQLMDVSNNLLDDNGMGHICQGLASQTGPGLGILVVWNNHLTKESAEHLSSALVTNKSVEMLNVGQNPLTDEFLFSLKETLRQNKTLLRLGMQSTQLGCPGVTALAEIIGENPILQRIDLRDNNIQVQGLMALASSMKVNSSITQLDLDDGPRKKNSQIDNLQKYMDLVAEIRECCRKNERGVEEADLRVKLSNVAARKISLTCNTLLNRTSPPGDLTDSTNGFLQVEHGGRKSGRLRSPAPSPIPSPVASPSPTRTRFQVSKVTEDSPPSESSFFPRVGGQNSRFRVTTVSDPRSGDVPKITTPQNPPRILEAQGHVVESDEPPQSPPPPVHVSPPPVLPQQQHEAQTTPPRSRRLTSWMETSSLFSEAKAATTSLERLLGLFQNPFGKSGGEEGPRSEERSGDRLNNNTPSEMREEERGSGGGATWPQGRPNPQSPHSTSAPSLTALSLLLHGPAPTG